jgi:hypothetical protein
VYCSNDSRAALGPAEVHGRPPALARRRAPHRRGRRAPVSLDPGPRDAPAPQPRAARRFLRERGAALAAHSHRRRLRAGQERARPRGRRRCLSPRRATRARSQCRAPARPVHADLDGFSLHAAVCIPASERGRERLEHLCRIPFGGLRRRPPIRFADRGLPIARPPLSTERLSLSRSGNMLLRLRRQWRDGTTHLVCGQSSPAPPPRPVPSRLAARSRSAHTSDMAPLRPC